MSGPAGAGREDCNDAVCAFLLNMPVARLYGLRVVRIEHGRSTIELPFRVDFTHDGRAIQAGIVAALADFAGATAAMSVLPQGWVVMTTGFEVHNIAPAIGEALLGVGEVIKPGTRLAISRADVFAMLNGERSLCATALVTTRGVQRSEAGQA